jgi:hypothetical protein
MRINAIWAARAILVFATLGCAQTFHPEIPRVWDDQEVERFEVPLAQRDRSPHYMTSEQYYALKVRPIYKTYPVYAPGQEPEGYIEWLKQQEPEIIFDPSKLHTKEDWIRAGKLVFEAETLFRAAQPDERADVNPVWPIAKDGSLPAFPPGNVYIIRKKGVVETGINSCAGCHTRIMPDGKLLPGAQGLSDRGTNLAQAERRREMPDKELRRLREHHWVLYGIPWVQSRKEFFSSLTRELLARRSEATHPGVIARQGTSYTHPPHVPSLIGIKDIRYLDATGLVRHRSIGDLMRYAVVNEGLDTVAHYGDFQPSPHETSFSAEEGTRYSDEQLYALALYLYSLRPPPNPNPFDDRARRGKKVFQQQGCSVCHTPPLYTNNKLTPAVGFKVPDDLHNSLDIMNVSVGTDPTLALKTRRGTGFYKVPSLRGVWYRNAFGHGGWAETLEEWFDHARLEEDYVPKGFHIAPGPIRGHEFGLKLPTDDRKALIAFLKTL